MKTKDFPIDKRINLLRIFLDETIQYQEMKKFIAEKKGNDFDYLKAYDIIGVCEIAKEIIDGDYDLTV